MNPATFAYTSHSIQDLKISFENMLFCLLSHAYTAISETANRWKQILKYFDQSIGDKPAFLDPDYHVEVFSDEEVLSRFTKYSWAISTLRELRKSISQNVLQIRKLLEQETSATTTEEELEGLRRVRAMLCSELRNKENVASKLETKQKEATYLRDEVSFPMQMKHLIYSIHKALLITNFISAHKRNFAGGTRNSTRFNQNIKLLTCVGILFLALPLSLFTWSVNTFFSYLNLLTANLLAAAVYFLVLNEHRLVRISWDVYDEFIKNTLEAMKKDEDAEWATRVQE
ncbi:hypothetical protein EAF00_002065 [Botryotinia globosa]|nr:hypothetical protein EAF00_002065 [Botryotinia globosa]